jgi:hypothetical protein
MSPSDLTLTIDAADMATEIFVIDGDMNLVERGMGRLVTKPLPPGIYKVKARAGSQTLEQHVVLQSPNQRLRLPRFQFASPAPLADTSQTHEYHMAAAERESRRTHAQIGNGSRLFLLAREWTPDTRGWTADARAALKPRSTQPARGLSLLREDGKELVDIAAAGVTDAAPTDPWSACNIVLDPGAYRLVLKTPERILEQTVVACRGWQTQVFLTMADAGDARFADLSNASILMGSGSGVDVGDERLRWTEYARLALANQRKFLSDDVRSLLKEKFENPMHGIYGAHLLLLEPKPDLQALSVAIGHLRRLVGRDHPDVEALALASGEETAHVFRMLPMLRRSWAFVVEHTLTQPELVPADSLAAQMSSRICTTQPWLLVDSTKDPDEDTGQSAIEIAFQMQMAPAAAPAERTDSPFAAVRKLRESRASDRAARAPLAFDVMSDVAFASPLPPKDDDGQIVRLVKTLGIPRASVEELLKTGAPARAPGIIRAGGTMANEDKWCFAWAVPKQATEGADRAALVKAAKWNSGDVIPIAFLDGDPGVQARVKKAALAWTAPGMANLTFDFINDPNKALVRISFQFDGSWSTVGTTCRQVTKKTEPTMNYGWLTPQSTDEELQRVVLHEFGHALGLVHEHQNPAGGIKWNRDAVIRDLSGPPNNWPLDVIEHNMFEPQAKAETNYTALDGQSIMMYPIPKRWTVDGFSVGLNTALSDTDKKFIKKQYS